MLAYRVRGLVCDACLAGQVSRVRGLVCDTHLAGQGSGM